MKFLILSTKYLIISNFIFNSFVDFSFDNKKKSGKGIAVKGTGKKLYFQALLIYT